MSGRGRKRSLQDERRDGSRAAGREHELGYAKLLVQGHVVRGTDEGLQLAVREEEARGLGHRADDGGGEALRMPVSSSFTRYINQRLETKTGCRGRS